MIFDIWDKADVELVYNIAMLSSAQTEITQLTM